MLGTVIARLLRAGKSKLAIALIAALVLGGGATAMAMATAHAPLVSGPSATASPTGNHDDDAACTNSGTPTAPAASPTGNHDDDADATEAAGGETGDHEGSEHEQECEGSSQSPQASGTPEPTEHPQGTRTPEPGGD
jgi:hypothetical protein